MKKNMLMIAVLASTLSLFQMSYASSKAIPQFYFVRALNGNTISVQLNGIVNEAAAIAAIDAQVRKAVKEQDGFESYRGKNLKFIFSGAGRPKAGSNLQEVLAEGRLYELARDSGLFLAIERPSAAEDSKSE